MRVLWKQGGSSRRGGARFAKSIDVGLRFGRLGLPDSLRFAACPSLMSGFGGVKLCLGGLSMSHGLKRVCVLRRDVTCGRCFAYILSDGSVGCMGGSLLGRGWGVWLLVCGILALVGHVLFEVG
jgi:hypothetical protein